MSCLRREAFNGVFVKERGGTSALGKRRTQGAVVGSRTNLPADGGDLLVFEQRRFIEGQP